MLCVGVQRVLLARIKAALATRGLHADEIAPDYMLRFAETDTREVRRRVMVLMGGADCTPCWCGTRKSGGARRPLRCAG